MVVYPSFIQAVLDSHQEGLVHLQQSEWFDSSTLPFSERNIALGSHLNGKIQVLSFEANEMNQTVPDEDVV